MKKVLTFSVLLLCLSIFLIGCSGGPGSSISNEVIDLLESDGYILEERDKDSVQYYQTNMVNDKYTLDLEISELYIGYVNEIERWAEIIIFEDFDQASEFYDELMIEASLGRYVIQEEHIIIITFSDETYDIFNS